jgi:hypothetical protein
MTIWGPGINIKVHPTLHKIASRFFCNYDNLNTGAKLTVKLRNEMQTAN